MTELPSAVLLAQLRKLDGIVAHLQAQKAIVRDMLEEVPDIGFRTVIDPKGEIATHLVTVLPTPAFAVKLVLHFVLRGSEIRWSAQNFGEFVRQRETQSKPRVRARETAFARLEGLEDTREFLRRDTDSGMLPKTDDLLARSISIGIGIRDANLAAFGLRMRDGEAEARAVGATFRDAVIRNLH